MGKAKTFIFFAMMVVLVLVSDCLAQEEPVRTWEESMEGTVIMNRNLKPRLRYYLKSGGQTYFLGFTASLPSDFKTYINDARLAGEPASITGTFQEFPSGVKALDLHKEIDWLGKDGDDASQ